MTLYNCWFAADVIHLCKLSARSYSEFVTQDTASSNCSHCERCPYSDILCLVLDSYLTFILLILQKVKTAHKTLTSPSVTLRKLSTVLRVSKFLLRQRYLNLGSDNFSNRIRTAIRSYEKNFFFCNKWLCNVIEISFQGRDDKNIWKR